MPTQAIENSMSRAIMAIRAREPFFGTLLLHTDIRYTDRVPTAATDGRYIFMNPAFADQQTTPRLMGLLVHEVLHAALLHVPRGVRRQRRRWNVAADIVVNGIVEEAGFELPEGPVRDEELQAYSVEEVYSCLPPEQELAIELPSNWEDLLKQGDTNEAQLSAGWKQALRQAAHVHRQGKGRLRAGLERAIGRITEPQVDWRTALWRFATRTPTDFEHFDRRFLHQRLYLETLEQESVELSVCVDTSGSISEELLATFIGELRGITRVYPHVNARLYYADAELYGPYDLQQALARPTPEGGGGTSFVPFFDAIAEDTRRSVGRHVAVYFTDLYGDFPGCPAHPTLWVVPPGGAPSDEVPFGEVVRLREV